MASNSILGAAKKNKKDEFYTQLTDIEKELKHYKPHFKGKTVLCNCDDPFESNFFKYFVLNFNHLGLKKLIATSYVSSPVAGSQLGYQFGANGQLCLSFGNDENPVMGDKHPYRAVVTSVRDATGNGGIAMEDIAELFKQGENELTELSGDGDFRSPECLALLDEADIVCTNPPFSLFREYVATLVEHDKKFIIIGNKNAITFKEFFPLLKENKVWIGNRDINSDMWFIVPEGQKYEKIENGKKVRHIMGCWFTNLDIKKRHEELILIRRYTPEKYPKYDNYDAINVNAVADIPCDYDGLMGVPVTFMDKYSPDQFEIIGFGGGWNGKSPLVTKKYPAKQDQIDKTGKTTSVGKLNDGTPAICYESKPNDVTYYKVGDGKFYTRTYGRILIRNKHPEKPKEMHNYGN